MNIIPKVKEINKTQGFCDVSSVSWKFDDKVDKRVVNAAYAIGNSGNGTPIYVKHGKSHCEEYRLCVNENRIDIESDGAAGAFYAIATLKMMIKQSGGKIECCNIFDGPDMKYRGFYQDTTRGRIPTLDTLKKLVDTMADYKMNSLQLYVEHSFEFEEYSFCRKELGYLSADEIKELDLYCRERFIELIPSLSTFGHLYHLLQSDKYKHLCELADYQPQEHYWVERMIHHTINPLNPESFEVIKSLIDQHGSAFTSNYFNICCDETFDLGKDVNHGVDEGELYIGFVKKITEYLEQKGKTVMMWGDIVLKYPERIPELSDKTVFLNWDYGKEPRQSKVEMLRDKKQIVCPGTSTWYGFCERPNVSESNIVNLIKFGAQYGAIGVLNTNWGDLGNPASIDMAMYSMILGASVAWNSETVINDCYRKSVGEYHYGNSQAVDLLFDLGRATENSNWLKLLYKQLDHSGKSQEVYENEQKKCSEITEIIRTSDFADVNIKNEFLIAAQGQSLLVEWCSKQYGYNAPSSVEFSEWLVAFEQNWLRTSKPSELDEMIKMLKWVNSQY